ncbi:MAG: DUF1080 domain-containing protein [Phycisphaerales bacterium]|nr:DUF1080 domain-containing protein [Phycisphaerales bacterium]
MSSAEDAAVALVPIPLSAGVGQPDSAGEFMFSRAWTVVPTEKTVHFVQPDRNQGLGKRQSEWFDAAWLSLTPSGVNSGVRMPLKDGEPILARGGDQYRVGINLRAPEVGKTAVVVELQTADGRTLATSARLSPTVAGPEGEHRHFVDLEIPEQESYEGPMHLAFMGVDLDESWGFGTIELDQASIARIEADSADFKSLFNGKDFSGWLGASEAYAVKDSAIQTVPEKSGGANLYTEGAYGDFVLRFRFKVQPGSNNGVAIRAPLSGDAAYQGMEVQLLENSHPKYAGLKDWQFHGSIYGLAAAQRGYQRPPGEWNDQEIRAEGRRITVILNGKVITDVDLDEALAAGPPSGHAHPGARKAAGHIGFCGHGDPVAYKDLRIQPLSGEKGTDQGPAGG